MSDVHAIKADTVNAMQAHGRNISHLHMFVFVIIAGVPSRISGVS